MIDLGIISLYLSDIADFQAAFSTGFANVNAGYNKELGSHDLEMGEKPQDSSMKLNFITGTIPTDKVNSFERYGMVTLRTGKQQNSVLYRCRLLRFFSPINGYVFVKIEGVQFRDLTQRDKRPAKSADLRTWCLG